MDRELLQGRGVTTDAQHTAWLEGYRPVLGARATLVRQEGFTTYGLVMHLAAADIDRLYADPSVRAYQPEAVHVMLDDGEIVEALCYNLPQPVPATPPDAAYARKLHELATRLGFPASYLAVLEEGYRLRTSP